MEFLDHKRRPVTEADRKPGPYPYLGANGQQGTISDYLFDEKLVLLAEDGGHFSEPERGIAYRISGKTWVNNHAHVLRPGPGLDWAYLELVLKNMDIRKYISGTTRAKLTKGQAEKIEIPVPPLAEQRRIAAILDEADALRAKQRTSLTKIDDLILAIFLDMFGDPNTNPKHLPFKPLGDLGCLDRGVSRHRPRNAPELLGGPYPLIQTGDVSNSDGYIRTYQSSYSEIGLRQSKMWPAGTLCITITGANVGRVGMLAFDACFPDSVVGFTAENPGMAEYIRFWFSLVLEKVKQSATQSTQPNINLAILREYLVPSPPMDQVKEFAKKVKLGNIVRSASKQAVELSDSLFASLQHRAFRGEL